MNSPAKAWLYWAVAALVIAVVLLVLPLNGVLAAEIPLQRVQDVREAWPGRAGPPDARPDTV